MTPARKAFEEGVEILCQRLQQVEDMRAALDEARGAMRQVEEAYEKASAELQAQAKRVALLAAQAGIVGADRIPVGLQGLAVVARPRVGG